MCLRYVYIQHIPQCQRVFYRPWKSAYLSEILSLSETHRTVTFFCQLSTLNTVNQQLKPPPLMSFQCLFHSKWMANQICNQPRASFPLKCCSQYPHFAPFPFLLIPFIIHNLIHSPAPILECSIPSFGYMFQSREGSNPQKIQVIFMHCISVMVSV